MKLVREIYLQNTKEPLAGPQCYVKSKQFSSYSHKYTYYLFNYVKTSATEMCETEC